MAYRLGVDVGGTFTDLLLLDSAAGRFWRHKTPSTPADSATGILTGVAAICADAGIEPSAVETLLHGTTVATNAVLEGKGARVGLVVTPGYRQVMQIARSFVPGGLAGWIIWPKPVPLAALEDTVEAGGRIDGQGREVEPFDEAQVRGALETLQRRGVEAVTVSLMNAYLNGEHEDRIGALAAEIMPGTPVSLSHVVLPEMQEYERTLTTVANAAVRPVVGRYVRSLRAKLRDTGMQGRIALLRSDGGLMSSEKAEEHPVSLLMSGPAGGVAGALWVGRNAELKNILTLDVGGTSTDVALIENLEPRRTRTTEVGHLSVRASSLDVKTVGAGGGSIATVPELTGALRVGPQSAGAVPGPAAYGKGGVLPTVTDANVVLGYLPENLLGGAFRLDRAAATTAVQTIADAMGIDLMAAARGIIDIVNENMFGALRMISVQQGYDPRDFALMGFGGARPAARQRRRPADGQLARGIAGQPRRAVCAWRRDDADADRGGALVRAAGARHRRGRPDGRARGDGGRDRRRTGRRRRARGGGHQPVRDRRALRGAGVRGADDDHPRHAPRRRHRRAAGALRRGAPSAVHLQHGQPARDREPARRRARPHT